MNKLTTGQVTAEADKIYGNVYSPDKSLLDETNAITQEFLCDLARLHLEDGTYYELEVELGLITWDPLFNLYRCEFTVYAT